MLDTFSLVVLFQRTKLKDLVSKLVLFTARLMKDLDSWKYLLKVATIQNHRPLLDLAENVKQGEIPHVSYHWKWGSLFTMKRHLESISQTTAAASQIPEFNKRRAKTPSG